MLWMTRGIGGLLSLRLAFGPTVNGSNGGRKAAADLGH